MVLYIVPLLFLCLSHGPPAAFMSFSYVPPSKELSSYFLSEKNGMILPLSGLNFNFVTFDKAFPLFKCKNPVNKEL